MCSVRMNHILLHSFLLELFDIVAETKSKGFRVSFYMACFVEEVDAIGVQ